MTTMPAARYILRTVGVVLLGLLLTGCVDVGLASTFNEDGSASHTVELAVERSALGQLPEELLALVTDHEEQRQRAEAAGLEYEAIDEADRVGGRFSKSFVDGRDIGVAFAEIANAALGSGSEQPLPPGVFAGTFAPDADNDAWTFDLTIDTAALPAAIGAEASDLVTPEILEKLVDVTYVATFPGEVATSNGTRLDDTTTLWDLPLSGTTTLSASGDFSKGSGGSSWAIVLLVGGAIVAAGLVLGYWSSTRRQVMPSADAATIAAASMMMTPMIDHQPHIDSTHIDVPPG
jgi:hypothetical protein